MRQSVASSWYDTLMGGEGVARSTGSLSMTSPFDDGMGGSPGSALRAALEDDDDDRTLLQRDKPDVDPELEGQV
jgi:hypothetical protein